MAQANAFEGAIILTVFLIPIMSYLAYTKILQSRAVHPLPPPTEITQIYIHPIKSCHGISVLSARLLPTGLDLDRQWMWVTYPDYKFLTIRNLAKMTLIRPSYHADTDILTITAPSPNRVNEKLHFEIPAHPTTEWLANNTEVVDATIWGTVTPAHAHSPNLTAPFNAFFGKDVRLVYKPPFSTSPRPLVSNGAQAILGRNASTCFPDMMPILVASEQSIDELNMRLTTAEDLQIPITRFRPNIVVRGNKAWDEDSWKTLKITASSGTSMSSSLSSFWTWFGFGGLTLDVTQRCARCHVPNVNSETAEEHEREPWDTLMKYRRVDEGITFKPCFGMLCVPRGGGGLLEVGMRVEVMEVTDKHRYMKGM